MKMLIASIVVFCASTAFAFGGEIIPSQFAQWDSQSQYENAVDAVADFAAANACMSNITVERAGGRLLVTDVDSGKQMLVNVYVSLFQIGKGWQVKKVAGQTSCD